MAHLVYALTGAGEWDVHRAGCADVTRNANRLHYQQEPEPFDAATEAEVYDAILDDEMRELGYDENQVRILPCVEKALREEGAPR
jgi:hypothetical protein